jgi:hypothetical protein
MNKSPLRSLTSALPWEVTNEAAATYNSAELPEDTQFFTTEFTLQSKAFTVSDFGHSFTHTVWVANP